MGLAWELAHRVLRGLLDGERGRHSGGRDDLLGGHATHNLRLLFDWFKQIQLLLLFVWFGWLLVLVGIADAVALFALLVYGLWLVIVGEAGDADMTATSRLIDHCGHGGLRQ